jgi:hypothetical protein
MIPYSAVDAIDVMHIWYDVNTEKRRIRREYAVLPSLIVLVVALIPWAISGLLLAG